MVASTAIITSLKTDVKNLEVLQQIPYIWYQIQIQSSRVLTLFNFGSKVNTIIPTYEKKQNHIPWKICIGVQKIYSLPLETYSIALIVFFLQISIKKFNFLKNTFY